MTAPRSFYEEFTVAGNQLVEKIKELLEAGNIRRLIIKDKTGKRTYLEIPLTLGVAAGAGLTVFAPFLAAVAGLATMLNQAQIVIERYEDPEDAQKEDGPTLIEIDDE
jgi:hypothetical protein